MNDDPELNTDNNADLFSLNNLQHTFKLLRHHYPSLALEVQNLYASKNTTAEELRDEKTIIVAVNAELASEIITALAAISHEMAEDKSIAKKELIETHQTLLDWLIYCQQFIGELSPAATSLVDDHNA